MDLSNFQLVDTMSDMDMLGNFSDNNQQYNQRQQGNATQNNSNYGSFGQDIHLLFPNTTSSPHVDSFLGYHHQKNNLADQSPHYRTTSQSDCFTQEDLLTPLISPAMTPSFDYQMQSSHNSKKQPMNFSNELNFSPLSSPAMPPQADRLQQKQTSHFMSATQIREQYDQLEQAKLMITQKLSEIQSQQKQSYLPSTGTCNSPQNKERHPSNPVSSNNSVNSTTPSSNMEPATPASLMKLSRHKDSAKGPSTSYDLPVRTSQTIRKSRASKEKPLIKKKREPTDPSPRALKPLLISPTLRPGPQKLPSIHQHSIEDAERILATRSNYQNLMEGKGAALGIDFTSQIRSGLEVRRTAHKAAEQKRRDSLKEWFDKLRCEVEEGYVKRQKSLMSQVIQAQELERDGSTEGSSDTMKPLSKVLLLQYAYEYINSLKETLSEKDAIIQELADRFPKNS